MRNNIKTFLVFLALVFTVFSLNTFAQNSFSMQEVKVISKNSIEVIFSKDLIENSPEVSEFLLTSKADETEINIKEIKLNNPNSLILNLESELTLGQEYNLVAVFVSSKNGDIIEKGVDGMITFVVPENITEVNIDKKDNEVDLNAASTRDLSSEDINNNTGLTTNNNTGLTTGEAATNTEVLPKTGTKENLILLLALLLGLVAIYIINRKRA